MTFTKDPAGAAECATRRSELPPSLSDAGTSCTCGASAKLPAEASAAAPSACLASTLSLSSSLVAAIVHLFKGEQENEDAVVAGLLEQEAGLRPGRTGDDARRRLQNPNLRTTYPAERLTSLNKLVLDYRHALADGLPALVQAALKLEVATAEIARTEELMRQTRAVHEEFRVYGIYPETLATLNRLYSDHGISRHHWVTATDDQLVAIAQILRTRRDVEDRT